MELKLLSKKGSVTEGQTGGKTCLPQEYSNLKTAASTFAMHFRLMIVHTEKYNHVSAGINSSLNLTICQSNITIPVL